MADVVLEQPYYPAVFVARVVNGIIGIIEFALALRLLLELFGANTGSQFVAWVYAVTLALIGPFAGAFPSLNLGGGSVLDVVAVLAMIAYAVIGWLIIQLLSFIFVSANRVA